MANLKNALRLSGKKANLCFYELNGKPYVRSKSSLSRERVLKSKTFAKTREYASAMAVAAQIGSVVYKGLPIDIRDRALYRAITGEAASLLYAGKDEHDVQDLLWKKYIENTGCSEGIIDNVNRACSTRETNKKLRKVFLQRWESMERSYYYFKKGWLQNGYFVKERFRQMMSLSK
jgi:hypothetical protein